MKKFNTFDWCCILTIGLLLLCLAPMPYGYYTIVRISVMCLAVYIGIKSIGENHAGLTIICGGLTILFQPFFKIALGKELWNIVDVLVTVGIVVYIIYNKRKIS